MDRILIRFDRHSGANDKSQVNAAIAPPFNRLGFKRMATGERYPRGMPAPFATALSRLAQIFGNVFLNPGSTFSLLSLLCALVISAAFLLLRRRVRPAVLARALFPAKLWKSRSTRLDLGFFFLNIFVTGTLVGWSLFSYSGISHTVSEATRIAFGHSPFPVAPPWLRGAVLTVALFLAYDFAYWLDHYIKHKVPFLWEFHRVHHTAEVLSPLTVFRMHPVDSLIFYNITALIMGVVSGLTLFVLGGAQEATLGGTNLILIAFVFCVIHLQHSHIDIRITGILGRIFFSPAHHHIHHSSDPAHYDTNLGSCLAVWDWAFGTLILPERYERPGKYGAEAAELSEDPHSAWGSLITPFVRSGQVLARDLSKLASRQRLQPGE